MKIGSNSFGSFVEFLKWSNRDKIAAFAFLLFFCSDVLDAFLFRVVPNITGNVWDIIKPLENILLLIPIVFSCVSLKNKYNVWMYYLVIFLLFLLTWDLYPEYSEWFLHPDFGIENRFLLLTRGIYALLIISLFNSGEKIFHCLICASKINFTFYLMQYWMAGVRGYWKGISYDGQALDAQYNLLFGYNVVFCLIIFIAAYVYTRKIYYLFISPVCLYVLTAGGSRGALLCLLTFVLLYTLVYCKKCLYNFKNVMIILCMGLIISSGIVAYWKNLLQYLYDIGITSRTLDMLLSGDFLNGNGRDVIYSTAIQLINDGGLFGYGVYGDRYVIGRDFYWGYAHNFFLEIFVCFGYIGGLSITLYLFYLILHMIRYCKNDVWNLLLLIFLSMNSKLLISDSFWYFKPFWGLLGIMGVWRHMYFNNKYIDEKVICNE